MNVSNIILSALMFNAAYMRKTLPFLKEEYFESHSDRFIFRRINHYVDTYNNVPTKEVVLIDLENDTTVVEHTEKAIIATLQELKEPKNDLDWLIDITEKFCQNRAIELALAESIDILENKKNKKTKDAIPQILQDALAISFDTSIGHNYFEDVAARYDSYHLKENKFPFDLNVFNQITNGGVARKTLNILQAGTNVGKSLMMCHMAAANILAGCNVLYITLELSEEKVAQRIDANLFNIDMDLLQQTLRATFLTKAEKLKQQHCGRLFIKEFPTSTAGASHFRHLLNELRIKQNFVPDVIYVDYLSICASSRLKMSAYGDLYVYGKAIAEELRGLAVEFNVCLWTAMQTNRSGFKDSDAGLEHMAESFGVAATADFVGVVIQTEELKILNQYLIKQEKNRYADKGMIPKFYIGVNTNRMKLYEIEQKSAEPEKKSKTSFNFRSESVLNE